MKKTKIVATISDYRSSAEYVKALYDEGMNVVRMNTAHMPIEGAAKILSDVRAVSDKIAILIDTKGPEIRTIDLEVPLEVAVGEMVKVTGDLSQTDCMKVNYEGFVHDVPVGAKILIDDGETELEVKDKDEVFLYTEATNSGIIKDHKSVNVPGVNTNLPSLTAKDIKFIHFAIENHFDFIAHSFVRNKKDVLDIQKILNEHDSPIKIIAKIENQSGVDNIDEILEVAYGVMVARGDLGIEIPAEKIPGISRKLVRKCICARKPVIMATQMLHTMIDHPRPTRAEVSDIANAVFNRTDALMLSGETANGNYGVEAVKVMARVAEEVEISKDKRNDIIPPVDGETSAFLSQMAITASNEMDVAAIVTDTLSGHNARYLSSFRADVPVYAKCYRPRVMRELSLSYGVFPSLIEPQKTRDETIRVALNSLVDSEDIKRSNKVVYVGSSAGIRSKASFLEVINNVESVIDECQSGLVSPLDK